MDKKTFENYVSSEDFVGLFNEMGWDHSSQEYSVNINDINYEMTAVAEKHGFIVWTCKNDDIPLNQIYRSIDQKLRKTSNDYIIIYLSKNVEENNFHHLWVVPVKSVEKRNLIAVEYETINQTDFLYSKLNDLSFGITEEVTIVDVTQRIQKAFEINSEKITKDFYTGFRKQHDNFSKFIKGINVEGDKQWYVSVMLNRLMFCYFIQKKGFLNFDSNYLRNKLEWSKSQKGKNKFFKSFYKNFLCILFHGGLNSPTHDDSFRKIYGRIPYLNGGMFDEHQIEKEYKDLDIDDKAFEDLFDFFDKYKWHLDTRIEASGKDINPDVLGYIFEQYINDRAQMGAYYTKEDITEYIGKSCILPFLLEETEKKSPDSFKKNGYVWSFLKSSNDKYIYDCLKKGTNLKLPENIEKGVDTTKPYLLERRKDWNSPTDKEYALPTEIWRETVERRNRYFELQNKIKNGDITSINDFITYNLNIRDFVHDMLANTKDHLLIEHFYSSLRNISILDPTCGSGAFLFAALNILEPLYDICIERMQEFNKENNNLFKDELAEISNKYRSNIQYFIYKNIILRNLYGVDIMVEATEIAKLRLFLKMVAVVEVDHHAENLGLDPLPDIDFNIRCGNTLVGYANDKELNDDIESGDFFERETFEKNIKEKLEKVSMAFSLFKKIQLTQEHDINDFKKAKEELGLRLAELNDILNKKAYGSRDDIDYDTWLKNYQPFNWLAEYYEIIHDKGGFDVVIGNPPYVVYTKKSSITKKSVADLYTLKNYETLDCNNLYAFIIERTTYLSNKEGKFGMIIPVSLPSNPAMLTLRNLVEKHYSVNWISNYADRPSCLFLGVHQILTILISAKTDKKTNYSGGFYHWNKVERESLFDRIKYTLNENLWFKLNLNIENNILKKITDQPHIEIYLSDIGTYFSICGGTGGYWLRAFTNKQESTEFKDYHVKDKYDMPKLVLLINSSLFYWYWRKISDCRHLIKSDFINFPINIKDKKLNKLNDLLQGYEEDLSKTREIRGGALTYVQYRPSLVKDYTNEIDKVLAEHYGFTEEELDFIINYDIKYRMGVETEDESEK